MTIDTGASQQTVTLMSVGTSGAGGTGVAITPFLNAAHPSGALVVPQQR
jgi:hypothetical protein